LSSSGSGGSYNCGTSTGIAQLIPDIESNNSILLANVIALPVTSNGTVNNATDIDDYYVFTATSSASYSFSLSAYGIYDLDLYLIDSGLNLVAQSESATATTESFNASLSAGETYYVLVSGYDTSSVTRSYSLGISAISSSSAGAGGGGGGSGSSGSMGIFVLLLIMVSRMFRMAKNHTFHDLVISSSRR
jgi:hypothetical protein